MLYADQVVRNTALLPNYELAELIDAHAENHIACDSDDERPDPPELAELSTYDERILELRAIFDRFWSE